MLLAVFVCTYFKKEKKPNTFFFWHCKIALLSVISPRWPLSGWRPVGGGERKWVEGGHPSQGHPRPLGNVTHLSKGGKMGFESCQRFSSCNTGRQRCCWKVICNIVCSGFVLFCFLIEGKLAGVCSAHVTGCKLSVLRAPPPPWWPHGWFQL